MPVAHNQLDSSAEDFQDINYSAPYHNNNNIDPLNQKHATKIFQRFLEAEIIKCVPGKFVAKTYIEWLIFFATFQFIHS